MKNLKLKTLVAVAVLLASTTSAFAVQVTLIKDGLRASSGTDSTKAISGSATGYGQWDWNAGTGVLTQTGTLNAVTGCGPGCVILTDVTSGMVIDTVANTTTATSYNCIDGAFLPTVGASGCDNINLGGDFAFNTTMAYNVGGNANCINRTIGGDDTSTGNVRGLGTSAGGSCDPQDGAYMQWAVYSDTTGSAGGFVTLWNEVGLASCVADNTKNAACANQTKLILQVIPVPAAAWLFGSGLGLLGMARRRRVSAAA